MASGKKYTKANWKVPDSAYFELFGVPRPGRPCYAFKFTEEPLTPEIRKNAERRASRVLRHVHEDEFLEYLQEEVTFLNYERRRANYEKKKKGRA
jgi:hypothetical protein